MSAESDDDSSAMMMHKKLLRRRRSDECAETPQTVDAVEFKTLLSHLGNIESNQKKLMLKLIALSKSVDKLTKKMDDFSTAICGLNAVNEEGKDLRGDVHVLFDNIVKIGSNVSRAVEDEMETQLTDRSISTDISSSFKVAMTTGVDRDTIRAAYEDVRSDGTPTDWAVFKFEGARIVCGARGSDFNEFRDSFGDDDRAFGYIRLQMGDEMSKRRKFLFVTWVGPNVSVINRAKMSTDKALMKDIISNFAVELQLESRSEIDMEQFKDTLNRAGGANYGTGVRDL